MNVFEIIMQKEKIKMFEMEEEKELKNDEQFLEIIIEHLKENIKKFEEKKDVNIFNFIDEKKKGMNIYFFNNFFRN